MPADQWAMQFTRVSCIVCAAKSMSDIHKPWPIRQPQIVGQGATAGRSRLELREEVVEGVEQAHVVDGFTEQIQYLQAEQVAYIVHIGVSGNDNHR